MSFPYFLLLFPHMHSAIIKEIFFSTLSLVYSLFLSLFHKIFRTMVSIAQTFEKMEKSIKELYEKLSIKTSSEEFENFYLECEKVINAREIFKKSFVPIGVKSNAEARIYRVLTMQAMAKNIQAGDENELLKLEVVQSVFSNRIKSALIINFLIKDLGKFLEEARKYVFNFNELSLRKHKIIKSNVVFVAFLKNEWGTGE